MLFSHLHLPPSSEALLSSMVEKQQVPHGILISCKDITLGTEVGKALASALICPQNFCKQCYACNAIASGQHPDVIWIEKEADKNEITIDKIRGIRSQLYHTPALAPCKVYFILHGDFMNKNSQNALLKSLEDPPPHVYFFLICENPSPLLPTILSRVTTLDIPTSTSLSLESTHESFPFVRHLTNDTKILQREIEQNFPLYELAKNIVIQSLSKEKIYLLSSLSQLVSFKELWQIESVIKFVQKIIHLLLREKDTPNLSLPIPQDLQVLISYIPTHSFILLYEIFPIFLRDYKKNINPNLLATHYGILIKQRLEHSI